MERACGFNVPDSLDESAKAAGAAEVSRQCPSCGGSCGYTKRKGCQYNSPANEYKRRNPFGGVARVFECAAARIKFGEPMADVMDDYGLQWKDEKGKL